MCYKLVNCLDLLCECFTCRPDEISVSLVRVKDPYLKLNELGTVLGQLSQDFPGIYKKLSRLGGYVYLCVLVL